MHWHGIALRNDMDGVHDLTMSPVAAGSSFDYAFTVPDAGTFWFHPHMGLELDRGLYAPLIVEDADGPVSCDVDAILVFDDWLDGYGRTPEQVLDGLKPEVDFVEPIPPVPPSGAAGKVKTGVPFEQLVALNEQLLKLPDGTVRVLVEGQRRATLHAVTAEDTWLSRSPSRRYYTSTVRAPLGTSRPSLATRWV